MERVFLVLLVLMLTACASSRPARTATPTLIPSPMNTPSPTPIPANLHDEST